ncbi:hypothetical protein UPM517_0430 [Salmonella enterica subsp. enterica serovar Stanley]|nr:hypothetical protein UPM517_0430 [Salmonella enterica subsp. enterica serovar Stanley]
MVNSALWFSAWFGGKFRSKRTFASAQEKRASMPGFVAKISHENGC